MKPYSMQELEECGFLSKIFGSKPTENGWKELNNLLAAAPDALAVSADDVHHALKKWGVKFNDDNFNQRSGIYRKLADVIFTEVQNKEDSLWAQLAHLAEILELPPHLAKQADKAAKTAAYFVRCRDLLAGFPCVSRFFRLTSIRSLTKSAAHSVILLKKKLPFVPTAQLWISHMN